MRLTGVHIDWPAQLKPSSTASGAKSSRKRDPYVKLVGPPDAIEFAKQLLQKELRVKVGFSFKNSKKKLVKKLQKVIILYFLNF
jgi:hypothetical protein